MLSKQPEDFPSRRALTWPRRSGTVSKWLLPGLKPHRASAPVLVRRYGTYFALIPFEAKAGQVYKTEWVEQGEWQQVPALKLVSGPK